MIFLFSLVKESLSDFLEFLNGATGDVEVELLLLFEQ